jgi:capsular polysaccharide biosynthesis protein
MNYQAEILEYINIIKRGKYIILISMVFSIAIGMAVAFNIPSVYRSQAILYHLQTQIPETMLTSFVNAYLENAVKFIENSILTREKCLKIINEVKLYPDLINKVPADDLVVHMKNHYGSENIYITAPVPGTTQEIMIGVNIFFDDKNPKAAFDVMTILSSEFIAGYKQFRERFASVTSSFFLDEQQRLKEEIIKIDKKIAEFKEKHVNELPELFQANYNVIESLNQRLLNLEQEARVIIERKILLQSQLAQIQPSSPLEGISGGRIVTPEEKLASLRTELAILRNQVSKKHPDIIRVQKEIEGLEKIVSTQQQTADFQNDTKTKQLYLKKRLNTLVETGAYNPAYLNLVTQLDEADAQIESLNRLKRDIYREMEKYQKRIENSPVIEREYNILIRDRESAQRRYEQLVQQALEADSSAAMEKREIGGRFIIAEPPNFPLRPIKPNRPIIIGASLMLGIVFSFLMIFAWEFLNPKIRSAQQIPRIASLPEVLELPVISLDVKTKGYNVRRIAIPFFILLIGPIILFAVNKYYKPLELDITLIKIIDLIKKKLIFLNQ